MAWVTGVSRSTRVATALLLTLITAIPRQLQAQIVADRQLAAAIMLPSSSDSTEIKPASPVPLPRNPWGSWPYATGDWGGLRSRLTEHGLQFSGAYTYDVSHGVRGGVRRGSIGRGLLDFGVTADLKPLAGLRGGTLFAGFFLHGGANGSDLTGDIQAYSNVDAERFSRLAEVWYEQRLFGDRARLKLGQVDANSEFAAIASAGEFINASAGFSPTIYALPTYPAPTPSVNLFLQPSGWLSIGAGLYRGSLVSTLRPGAEADAAFGIGEIAGVWAEQGRVAFGYWRHQGYAPVFGGGMQRAPQGWYATFEQRLSGIAATDSTPARGLTFLAKFGSADERVSDFAHHAMVGVVAESPFGVAGHGAGVMVSAVDLSDVAAAGYSRNETSLEAFYRWPALGFLTLRPDVQYIVAPSGATGVADAVVGTLRAELAF